MPDSFRETTKVGFGSRIINSIKGLIFGPIFIIISLGILYWNEGRVDLSIIAKTATEISSEAVNTDTSLTEKLVSTTGRVNSEQSIGDNLFLKPDTFIEVVRKVEMYAWIEKSESRSTTNTGGSETTETVYTYTKDWVEESKSTSDFKHPEGHENPEKGLASYSNKVAEATIGAYRINPQNMVLPGTTGLTLTGENITLSEGAVLENSGYLFIKKSVDGTFLSPQIGDLRVSYSALRPGFDGTIFGTLSGDKIGSYTDEDGNTLYRLFTGTRAEAIATLHTEYTTLLWILRFVGFLLMWAGLIFLFGPISVLLDILPIFGTISRALIGIATFLLSLVLTFVTILVSMLLHSFIALIITLVIVLGGIIAYFVRAKNKKQANDAIPAVSTETVPLQPSQLVQPTPPVNPLVAYVSDARARGMTNDQIRQELLNTGWTAEDISRVLD